MNRRGVRVLVDSPEMAKKYGERCEKVSRDAEVAPFFFAYALEACARAEAVGGNREAAEKLIAEAKELAGTVKDPGERDALIADLETI